jgi:uncharacterized protein YbjT (DUF2867 family)
MKVILFGATGMVGQGVLRECLLDPEVTRVVVIGRSSTGQTDAKLQEIVLPDPSDLGSLEDELVDLDACFYCLGVSSAGMAEADYRRVTYDLTLAVARPLVQLNPGMTFIFVSGRGTDSTARGRVMWARVKGETENALFELPFTSAYMFRPGIIEPKHGVQSKTKLYRVIYKVFTPLLALLKVVRPQLVTSTELLGRAMLVLAKKGSDQKVFENPDINALAGGHV